MLILHEQARRKMLSTAQEAYPHEACGVMIGSFSEDARKVMDARAALNQRKDSLANRYLIDPALIRTTEQDLLGSALEIVGFFHSHPDVAARPSDFDLEQATWPLYSYLIVSVVNGQIDEVRSWRLKEDRSAFFEEEFRIINQES